MNILIVEPYFTGSHAAWAEGFKRKSAHEVELLSLEGRYWKWRMHGGAVTLARMFMEGDYSPDLILATDMLDLTTFLSLTRPRTSKTPAAVYFHENQLTYPWSPEDRDVVKGRDRHYGFINFSTALAADKIFFNSRFHMDSFLTELSAYLKAFPDFKELASIEAIREKSVVLYPGMDFERLGHRGDKDTRTGPPSPPAPPLILWNHRWEHDKNPEEFFRALYVLADKGLSFEVAVLGENFSKTPVEFDAARERLKGRILHYGFVEDLKTYALWLKRADILPVTSIHDFFGCSVVEAVWCGCFPILPKRLAYPEHLPATLHDRHFYTDFDGLVKKLESAIINIEETRKTNLMAHVERYGWEALAPVYDAEMERSAARVLPYG
jgi:glycosyltransferase involved in cell wall biosynthesis